MGCLLSLQPKYDKYDWEELPDEAKEAAKILGYNQRRWDNDKEPKVMNKDWNKLNEEQKEAAMTLGYDEEMWDNG